MPIAILKKTVRNLTYCSDSVQEVQHEPRFAALAA